MLGEIQALNSSWSRVSIRREPLGNVLICENKFLREKIIQYELNELKHFKIENRLKIELQKSKGIQKELVKQIVFYNQQINHLSKAASRIKENRLWTKNP